MIIILTLFGLASLISAWMVIHSINPIHSVLYLVFTFVNLSFLLLILGIEFLPLLFLILYVGAIAILFLFVIMMLNIKLVEILDNTTKYLPVALIIGFIFLWQIFWIFNKNFITCPTFHTTTFTLVSASNIKNLANVLYTNYFIYFLISGLILLVAIIGAIILTISHEDLIKRQDLFAQTSTKINKTLLTHTC